MGKVGLIAVAVATLVVVLIPAASPASGGCYRHRPKERRLAHLTNRARTSRGLSAYRLDRHLSRVARNHSKRMARENDLFHTPTYRLSHIVTRWNILGENVGVAGSVRRVHHLYLQSAPHRLNILSSTFRHFGVGVIRHNRRIWTTVVFEASRNPGTRLSMPSC
jgi:uncharacterized protein YkwD